MNIRDLEYIAAVARLGSFRKAAEACFVTQPTLSAQIAKVERDLGVMIFERRGRGISPTPAGQAIIDQVRVVLEEVARLRQISTSSTLEGPFRVGLIPTLGSYLMARLLPLFRDHYPDVRLHLREEKTAVLLERLTAGELDIAIVSTVEDRSMLNKVRLLEEELLLAVPPSSPVAKKKTVTPKDIESLTYIELEEGHCLREDAVVSCRLSRHGLRDTILTTGVESARQMVMAGIGGTIMPAMAVDESRADATHIRYLRFASPVPTRPINLLYRRRAPNAASLETLAGEMRAYLQ